MIAAAGPAPIASSPTSWRPTKPTTLVSPSPAAIHQPRRPSGRSAGARTSAPSVVRPAAIHNGGASRSAVRCAMKVSAQIRQRAAATAAELGRSWSGRVYVAPAGAVASRRTARPLTR